MTLNANALEVSISKAGLDPDWDSFLETRPDSCHQQSSLWAKVKATIGWNHLRLVVRENGKIIGGVQVLHRPIKPLGSVGYVSKGPVIASDDPAVQDFILDQLDRAARAEHILFLKVQPAYSGEDVAQRLLERGARPSKEVVVSQATARVDLSPEPEAIMACMPRKKRQDIRRAERRGVTIREGTETDMPMFHRLIHLHSKRQKYRPYPKHYHQNVWSTFFSTGHAGLLVAEYKEEVLAEMMMIAFGDVISGLFIGDTGQRQELNAHSLIHWHAMLWGKSRECNWYDFGGINMSSARLIMNDQHIPDEYRAGRLDRFKMSFGSQVLIRPNAYDISYIWPRRLTSRMIPALLKRKALIKSLLGGSLFGDLEPGQQND